MPPANDDFANATLLDATEGLQQTFQDDNTGATSDGPYDPLNTMQGFGSHTIWYKVDPVAHNRVITVETSAPSSGTPLDDSVLGVFTGTVLQFIQTVAVDDDSGPGFYSLITQAPIPAGETCYIELTGYSNAYFGAFTFTWTVDLPPTPPANDDFANAQLLDVSAGSHTIAGTTVAATRQTPDPLPDAGFGPFTVWYKIPSQSNKYDYLFNLEIAQPSILGPPDVTRCAWGIYHGADLSSLVEVDSGFGYTVTPLTAQVVIPPGVDTYLEITGYSGGFTGNFDLTYSMERYDCLPQHDHSGINVVTTGPGSQSYGYKSTAGYGISGVGQRLNTTVYVYVGDEMLNALQGGGTLRSGYFLAYVDGSSVVVAGIYLQCSGGVLSWMFMDSIGGAHVHLAGPTAAGWHQVTINMTETGSVVMVDGTSNTYLDVGIAATAYMGQYGTENDVAASDTYLREIFSIIYVNPPTWVSSTFIFVYFAFGSNGVGPGTGLNGISGSWTQMSPLPVIDPQFTILSITTNCSGSGDNGALVSWTGLDPLHTYSIASMLPDFSGTWDSRGAYATLYPQSGCVALPNTQAEVDDPSPGFWDNMVIVVYEDSFTCGILTESGTLTWNPGTLSYTGGGVGPVTTLSASSVTQHSFQLNAVVDPEGVPSTAYFEWGPSVLYGNQTTPQDIGSNPGPVAVNDVISGLEPGTLYYFRAVRNP